MLEAWVGPPRERTAQRGGLVRAVRWTRPLPHARVNQVSIIDHAQERRTREESQGRRAPSPNGGEALPPWRKAARAAAAAEEEEEPGGVEDINTPYAIRGNRYAAKEDVAMRYAKCGMRNAVCENTPPQPQHKPKKI